MGKSQKQKKRSAKRHNPVRVPDGHLRKGLEAAEATSTRKEAVLPILSKLESVDALERSWACSAVSNLIQNDPSTRRLLQGKNVVGALITRLSDSVEEVVVEASGSLRNLCIDGGFEICAEMYNKNILAPLRTFIPKISESLQQLISNPKSAPHNASELVFGLAENVITLIWCLSETSNKALNAINDMRLVPFLLSFLENREKLPSRTVAAAAQCLYVLSDDNPVVVAEIRSDSTQVTCLLSVAQSETAPLLTPSEAKDMYEERLVSIRLLATGILRNVSPLPAPSAASAINIDHQVALPTITPVVSSISLLEASNEVAELVSKPRVDSFMSKPSLKHAPRVDHKDPAEMALDRIEARLRNVQLSLEILTGMCATLPDPEPIPDDDYADEEEDIEDEEEGSESGAEAEGDVEMQDAPMDTHLDSESKVNGSNPLHRTLLPNLLSPLLTLIQPTPLSFPPLETGSAVSGAPPTHPPTTSALGAIHVSALECLNNACLALALEEQEKKSASATDVPRTDIQDGRLIWSSLWQALRAVGLEGGRGQERRKEMWEIAAGVMWGMGIIWKGCIVPEEEHVKLLMQLCEASSDAQVKVKCLGALESLAYHPDSTEVNKIISEYLLTVATTPPSETLTSEPIFQAASSLIDIFSDETLPHDVNFRQGGFLAKLSGPGIDSVRKAVKAVNRKSDGGRELRAHGEETLENLRDFLKYRRSLKL